MDNILAVCDYEQMYVYRLTEYLNIRKAIPFEVMAFDSPEKFVRYARKHPVEVLLIAGDFLTKEIKDLSISQIYILGEETIASREEYPCIYKYQSAESIMKAIMGEYAKTGKMADCLKNENREVQIVGVYTPVGRCLQTSFAIVMGQLLAKKKRTLYINFEPFSGFSRLLQKDFDNDLIDLMYFLNGGRDKFVYKIGSMTETIGNLDFIPPAKSFLDLAEIGGPDWEVLIHEIIRGTDYEIIILDLSDNIRGLFDILKQCHKIYTIVKSDGIAMAKIDQYEKLLEFTENAGILSKTNKQELPIFKEIGVSMENLPYSQLAEYMREIIRKDFV